MFPVMVIALLGFSTAPATALLCTQPFFSQTPPSSAHSVRPSDVAVLSAIGLPATHSSELSQVLSRLHELLTMLNPTITSILPAQSHLYSQSSYHRPLVDQAKELSLSLTSNQDIDLDTHWTLVMLFVQVDELCVCQDKVSETITAVVQNVAFALQELQSQLSRTIVNVAVWDGEYVLREDTAVPLQSRMCQCMEDKPDGELTLLRAVLTHLLQESLDRHLVEKDWYSNRDDFTVLLQSSPFITADPADFISSAPRAVALHTDKLAIQMWSNLLQSTTGQQNMEDDDTIISVPCPTEDRPFLRTERNTPTDHPVLPSSLRNPVMGTSMPCQDRSPSNSPPTSVHALRPADINVVAALGDSLTAGNGVGSGSSVTNLLDVMTQYRGLSWSIGGDANLTTVSTLPNILREFNPVLIGYSVGTGKESSPEAFLNQAVAGQRAKDIPAQVRALVARMKNDKRVNFQEHWKVITLFIGGNDLCDFCFNSLFYSSDNYVRHIRDSLDYLHEQVPRALVNLVQPLYIPVLREVHKTENAHLKCPTWLAKILCTCVISPKDGSKALQNLEALNREFQRELHNLVESGRYDTHDNFTVVLQPFPKDLVVPMTTDGHPDRTYFSPDCFHLSQKAHTLMARSLWNNMLEPLGEKTSTTDFNHTVSLKCPSKNSPFVRTYVNSNYTYKGPTPTTPPIANWGSDFSCRNMTTSSSVPTSVHELRPEDIKVVAALGDSNTAAVGAKAKNVLQLETQYRGVSWSIGGNQALDTVTTLPNILKKFNPSLIGFSKGQGFLQNKGFNMAVPEAKAIDIPAQVQALIKAMKDDEKVDFDNDWKLVTLLVGGRDLCDYCMDQNNLTPKNFSEHLMLSLDMLYKEVPRMMVNLIKVMEMNPLRSVRKKDLICSLLQRNACPCFFNPEDNSPELTDVRRINQEYQMEMERLVYGGRYDGRKDFTVIVQPYLQNSFVPFIGDGQPDMSFFSVDCFHISERAHAEMAIALWNNMLEPVGMKQVYNNFTYDRTKINCPSEDQPFIFTKMNSHLALPVRPTSPAPVTDTTTLPSGLPQCDSPMPVWVPVVLGKRAFPEVLNCTPWWRARASPLRSSSLSVSKKMAESELNVDSIISRLLEVRGCRPGKIVQMTEAEVRGLCIKSREIFLSQPILLELEAPLKICGDIHGQYTDLLRLFEYGGFPPEANYLFLGDYVDRGKQSLETICLLLAYKIKYPENFFLLRGNHECASINRIYGFYDECKRRFNIKLWKTFTDCFNCLPIAAIIDEKIFCCHGGLSPDLQSMEQIRRIMRPTDVPDTGLLCDLLWSDPDKDVQGWGENDRGVSFTFGADVVSKFLNRHDLDLICRAHQVVEDGYEFFAKRQLVTLFSAPNYCGEFDNAGGMMSVDESLMCSFQILKPSEKKAKYQYGGVNSGRPVTPPRTAQAPKKR
ncbi:hypothetical protein UPYG_G00254660 [Umbra pygmaea]